MLDLLVAVSLGVAAGLLVMVSFRSAWIGWLALAPLCTAVYLSSPLAAAAAGFAAGALPAAYTMHGKFAFMPSIARVATLMTGLGWAVAFGLAALVWPDATPAWGALIFPLAVVVVSTAAERQSGRLGNVLLPTQQGHPALMRIARLGGGPAVTAALALVATVPAILLVALPPTPATIAAAAVAGALASLAVAIGLAGYRRTLASVRRGSLLRVAAVSVDGDASDGPATGPGYRDVAKTVARYEPHVRRALREGARLVVLPEVAVTVTSAGQRSWLEALAAWAKEGRATVVAGYMDEEAGRNRLAIADEHGEIAALYDKQHPLKGAEPGRYRKMAPPLVDADVPVSGVICYDADYSDVLRPVARAGGLLAVPSNDWRAFQETHHRATAWAAVIAGVPVVRSTGHGISAVFDATGSVLARASSFDGPVVLVTDVPVPAAVRQGTRSDMAAEAAEKATARERSSAAA